LRRCGLDSSGSGYVAAFCEHDDETSGSIKIGEFIYQLRDYQLLKKNPAP